MFVITGVTAPARPELAEIHSDAVIFRDDFEMTEGLRQDLWCVYCTVTLSCSGLVFFCIFMCLLLLLFCHSVVFFVNSHI